MRRKQTYIEAFSKKIHTLIEKENVKGIWNESTNISNAVIRVAVYYLLSNGQSSISDIRKACNRAIKDYEKEHPI